MDHGSIIKKYLPNLDLSRYDLYLDNETDAMAFLKEITEHL